MTSSPALILKPRYLTFFTSPLTTIFVSAAVAPAFAFDLEVCSEGGCGVAFVDREFCDLCCSFAGKCIGKYIVCLKIQCRHILHGNGYSFHLSHLHLRCIDLEGERVRDEVVPERFVVVLRHTVYFTNFSLMSRMTCGLSLTFTSTQSVRLLPCRQSRRC